MAERVDDRDKTLAKGMLRSDKWLAKVVKTLCAKYDRSFEGELAEEISMALDADWSSLTSTKQYSQKIKPNDYCSLDVESSECSDVEDDVESSECSDVEDDVVMDFVVQRVEKVKQELMWDKDCGDAADAVVNTRERTRSSEYDNSDTEDEDEPQAPKRRRCAVPDYTDYYIPLYSSSMDKGSVSECCGCIRGCEPNRIDGNSTPLSGPLSSPENSRVLNFGPRITERTSSISGPENSCVLNFGPRITGCATPISGPDTSPGSDSLERDKYDNTGLVTANVLDDTLSGPDAIIDEKNPLVPLSNSFMYPAPPLPPLSCPSHLFYRSHPIQCSQHSCTFWGLAALPPSATPPPPVAPSPSPPLAAPFPPSPHRPCQ